MVDFFKLFDIQPQHNLNLSQLEQRYQELSLRYHPDLNQDDNAAELCAQVNDGYRILKDEASRSQHLIDLWLPQANKNDLPQGFLEEAFQLQEEIESAPDKSIFQEQAQHALQKLLAERHELFSSYSQNQSQELLRSVQINLNCMRYWNRIINNLSDKHVEL